MTFGSLFSGIGGFDLGLERANMVCKWQVENDEFCLKILNKHWPDVPKFGDIKEVDCEELGAVDLICGGFPCQPFSVAGKRGGSNDDRFLWPQMFRIIQGIKPRYVIGENVVGIVNMELDRVLSDLENEGYSCGTFIIPACAVNAPHRRDRVWIIAYAERPRGQGRELYGGNNAKAHSRRQTNSLITAGKTSQNPDNDRNRGRGDGDSTRGYQSLTDPASRESREQAEPEGREGFSGGDWERSWIETAAEFCRVDARISNRVDRLKCLGNAVVPQIVEIIGRAIMNREGAK